VSEFVNLRVDDLDRSYQRWSAAGAEFLTEPVDLGHEKRASIRDPDGHLVKVGERYFASVFALRAERNSYRDR
jgi:predicted lactoylglutathione lyase